MCVSGDFNSLDCHLQLCTSRICMQYPFNKTEMTHQNVTPCSENFNKDVTIASTILLITF